ncbi:HAD family hydrolase [Thiomonas sp. FB-Cd]|uniref:HAD family hydrolase n=1 Tax=Thiomonas sp. FB-Cd TaxID=1158292 RepID=UPI00068F43D2|nr:HAD-IA family hydrolase [Thiomonas sp. FB-Cd]
MTGVYKAILFDLDGTFADTAPDLAAAVNRMRMDRGLPALPVKELRPMASHGARGLLQIGFATTPGDSGYEALRDEFLRNYAENICVDTQLFPGVDQVLGYLDRHAIPWGIVTNKIASLTLALLDALRLPSRPACVVSGDTTAHPKPAPDPLLHAAAMIGIAPAQCLYLGDDLRDMQSAQSAGMGAAAAAYGYCGQQEPRSWGAHYVLEQPEQLLYLGLV